MIDINDINLGIVRENMFVAFYTGFMDKVSYGTKKYFKEHPQLSHELIDALLDKHISMIGIDCAGVKQGKEHTPTDQYCADRNVFIIENLLDRLEYPNTCVMNTYPTNFNDMTGLPCSVVFDNLLRFHQ